MNKKADELFEYVNNDDIGERSFYKAPGDKVFALKKAVEDLIPYFRAVDSYTRDPILSVAIETLFDANGWQSSSIYC